MCGGEREKREKEGMVVFPRRKPVGGLGHWDCLRDLVVLGIWDSMCSEMPLPSPVSSCHIPTLHSACFFFILFYFIFINFCPTLSVFLGSLQNFLSTQKRESFLFCIFLNFPFEFVLARANWDPCPISN